MRLLPAERRQAADKAMRAASLVDLDARSSSGKEGVVQKAAVGRDWKWKR